MLIPGIIASSISGSKVVTGSYESIATVTVGSGGTSSVTFSSIASTWSHLQLRAFWNLSGGGNCKLNFNSDTGANYKVHLLYGDGSTATAGVGAVSPNALTLGYKDSSSTSFEASVCDILSYANSNKYKTIRTLNGNDMNGSGYIEFDSGLWMNTNAITSISLTPQAGTIAQYSHFALYGVKA